MGKIINKVRRRQAELDAKQKYRRQMEAEIAILEQLSRVHSLPGCGAIIGVAILAAILACLAGVGAAVIERVG